MASSVSICSNALLMLGDSPINSLSENNDRARLATNLYSSTRDAVLRSHPWNCATKRVVLSPEVAAPAFDYTAQFAIPGDLLRILQVGEHGAEIDYRIEGNRILADTDTLYLAYIYRNESESTWDALLVSVMEHAMAAKMAYAITKSTSQQQLMEAKYADALRLARAVDGQDNPPATFGDFPLLQSRFHR